MTMTFILFEQIGFSANGHEEDVNIGAEQLAETKYSIVL